MSDSKSKTLIFRLEQEVCYEIFCDKFGLEDNEATLKIWEKLFNNADDIKKNVGYVDIPLDDSGINDGLDEIVGTTLESLYEEVTETQPCDGCSCELESNSKRTYYTRCGVYCKKCMGDHTCEKCRKDEEEEEEKPHAGIFCKTCVEAIRAIN